MKNKKGQMAWMVSLAAGTFMFILIIVLAAAIGQQMGSATAQCSSPLTFNSSSSACEGCLNTSYGLVYPLCTMGMGKTFLASFIANITLSTIPIDNASIAITCPNGTTLNLSASDFSPSYSTGNITMTDNPRSWTNETFTSLFDTNVSLWKATNNISYADSIIVFNCSSFAEVYDAGGNYTITANYALMNVLSTGAMVNNTAYCYNATGAIAASGANCTASWTNSTIFNSAAAASAASTNAFYVVNQLGAGGLAGYLPLVFIAIIAISIISMLGFNVGGNRPKY